MADKDLHIDFPELASKYLSGNATDGEVRQLESWVEADQDHRRQFTEFKKAWMLAGLQHATQVVDIDAEWQQTSSQLFREGKVVSLASRRRRWLGMAAGIAILVAAVSLFLLRPWGGASLEVATTDLPETLQLADGSQVILNRTSSLAYQEEKAIRKVQLVGDAYFDVARDESRPFVIQAREVEIEVLGTSFYVDARPDQPNVRVTVESGRVAVRHQNQEAILEAGDMAEFEIAANQLRQQENEDPNFRSLKTQTLTFENTPLSEVVSTLNRQYRANVRLDSEALSDCPLSATYTNKSLNAVLTILESSLGITVEINGSEVILSGECLERE